METDSESADTNGGDANDTDSGDNRIAWHPAFFGAIQLELDEYSDALQFISEYQLTTEPLRIDVVIIKKTADIPIKKNIAEIFRPTFFIEHDRRILLPKIVIIKPFFSKLHRRV